MSSFYLAGKNLGALVLFFTLYATQYSGNTLIGYPGEAYRLGFAWIMSIGFMMAIVVAYLLFAPALYRVSQQWHFVTPGDWIAHRFGSSGGSGLTLFAGVLFVVAIANYLLAQLLAVGHIVSGLSGGAIPFWAGVVVLGIIILFYETLGGMQAVAWTDCIQGLLLFVGLLGMLAAVVSGGDRHRGGYGVDHRPSTVESGYSGRGHDPNVDQHPAARGIRRGGLPPGHPADLRRAEHPQPETVVDLHGLHAAGDHLGGGTGGDPRHPAAVGP